MLANDVRARSDHASLQAVIDALSAHTAVCADDGQILAVNTAWRTFADENGGRLPAYGVGLNYAHLLDGAVAWAETTGAPAGEVELAREVVAGLRGVLSGAVPQFQTQYRCDAPGTPRWFLLTISHVADHPTARVVVAHENITAVKAAEATVVEHSAKLMGAFSSVIESIARLIEQRDPYTAGHQRGAARWCERLAREIGFQENRIEGLLVGAGIHDIGKIAVPAEILTRPGRLSALEMEMIRSHSSVGYEVLRDIDFPWPIADMVYQHHENFDGTGYPRGLRGEEICMEARIIAVADMFDAMTSHRPYRAARSVEEAVDELVRLRGTRYDPTIVDAMLRVLAAPTRISDAPPA